MENRPLRRNYFPEPQFQMRFLRVLVLGALVQMVLTGGILYHFLRENYTLLVKYAALEEPMAELLYHELGVLIAEISATFFAYLIGLTILGVRYSHQVAGVISALKRTIQQINDGKEAYLELRPGDEFKDVQDGFNTMVKTLRRKQAS